jgi:hypothetical protein
MNKTSKHRGLWWQKMLLLSGLGTMFFLATAQEEPAATADCCMEEEEADYIIFDPPVATLKLNGSRIFTMSLKSGKQVTQYKATESSDLLRSANTLSDTLHVFAASEAELPPGVKEDMWAQLVMREIDPNTYLGEKILDELVSTLILGSFGAHGISPIDLFTLGPTDAPVRVVAALDDKVTLRGTVTITIDPYEFVPGGIQ